MSSMKPFDQPELIRLALVGLDAQIAEMQAKRAQLAASLAPQPTAVPAVKPTAATVKAVMPSLATPAQAPKSKKMPAAQRAKISAAAKARWDKVRQAKAEAANTKPATKNEQVKKAPTTVKAKKTLAKK